MSEEILNLSTIVDRKKINIESRRHPKGKLYELASTADLGPYEHANLIRANAQVSPLLAKTSKLTAAEERSVKSLLDSMSKLIVFDIEPTVLSALTIQQKSMIVLVWASTVGAAEGNRKSRRTTAASSPGSKRSTAATRKRGSTPQRGR